MKALSVIPGKAGSAEMIDVPPPEGTGDGALLIRSLSVGICGTDLEIIAGEYGEAPPGEERLILGHESLGEVVEAPTGSGFAPGQLVVGVVRRPDPEPCDHCAVGEWDMCRNGLYTECGIKQRHGYAQEFYRLEPQYAVAVDAGLGDLGVLIEPASVIGKAGAEALHFLERSNVPARTALVTGAGPIGLLAALATTQRGLDTFVVDLVESGPKPDLVRDLGATYHSSPISSLSISPEVIIECTGMGSVVQEAARIAAPGAVIALTGIAGSAAAAELDLNLMNKNMVLTNKVLFGSVNAGRRHYEMAVALLSRTDPEWLRRLISRRVPRERWREAIERHPDDVKVVLDMDGGA
jgi:threonine dehydrogenase-like Zn-dependent dehydrogenase